MPRAFGPRNDKAMIIVDYKKKYHKKIIHSAVFALKQGKIVAYPTDTSYGLAADAENMDAVMKLYRIKGRQFIKAVHIVVPSIGYGKKIVQWNKTASALVSKFFPGAITLVLPLKSKNQGYKLLSAGNSTIGLRMPANEIALDLAKFLKRPITATSANVSGKPDCYSVSDITHQFKNKRFKPDIVINAGRLIKRKPSTVVKIDGDRLVILRQGPVKI